MKYAIDTNGLTKRYGDFLAVDSLDMKVKNKSIFGFLGPNGAGKTTTIKMLTCLIQPTKGNATVSGYDIVSEPDKVREMIGMVPQLVSLYGDLTARENVSLCADYYGVPSDEKEDRMDDLMELVDIKYAENKLIKQMSGGQKQKVSVVASLIHKPEVLFLDEPTIGLDPTTKMVLWDLIQELNDNGHTIILCSHDMYEVEKLCENVGIMNQGTLVAFDTPQRLKDNLMEKQEELVIDKSLSNTTEPIASDILSNNVSSNNETQISNKKSYFDHYLATTELSILAENFNNAIIDEINKLNHIQDVKLSHEGRITVDIDQLYKDTGINEVIGIVMKNNAKITSISTNDPSLEDVFVNLTSKKSNNSLV
ncbi:ATP-binding cassette domain-containing protein [Methanobrevibacter filiformis]|uniref:Daunorubicin/doxorubicin resistance ATP-binding protein DrrA n=1 Tax=Methanobrevibacter filiformis TaxID=55758 RepID=A0A166DXE3_9EURY|nr:ATP-binding cassette domain-containing protein [Methanobrevibacter filiformis]KZX16053.1 daunorubicin/doxorubicin resistance ATP-binding protein DrrA [Methanobrevibacter filiformis]